MPSIIHDFPATGNHPLGLHCIMSIAERWTSCWFVPLGGPSRGALRLLRSSRYALTQPDAFGAGASRDGQAIAASLATIFTLHRSVAERRSPLKRSHLQSSRRMRRERSERSVRTQITSFSRLLPNPAIHHCSPTQGDAASPLRQARRPQSPNDIRCSRFSMFYKT